MYMSSDRFRAILELENMGFNFRFQHSVSWFENFRLDLAVQLPIKVIQIIYVCILGNRGRFLRSV